MKNWYLSKTIWANTLTVAAGTALALGNTEWLGPRFTALALAAAGSANIILRFVTSSPIATVLLQEPEPAPVPEVIHRHIVEIVKNDITTPSEKTND